MSQIPVGLKFLTLATSVTAFYCLVGQMVPQTEILPPHAPAGEDEVEAEDEEEAGGGVLELVRLGKEIFEGKGTCTVCHAVDGDAGPSPFPNLADIGARAADRVAELDDVGYLAQSLFAPNAFIVPGFNPGMPPVDQAPIGLDDGETLAVIAYLQSLGGEPTVTPETALPLNGHNGHHGLNGSGPQAAGTVVTAVQTAAAPRATPAPASLETAPAVDDPRIANGKRLYDKTCVACHGDRAQGNELLNAPRLAGQESWYIARQLNNFISGARGTDPTDVFGMQMRPMAMMLAGEEEVEDLAAYLSSLNAGR